MRHFVSLLFFFFLSVVAKHMHVYFLFGISIKTMLVEGRQTHTGETVCGRVRGNLTVYWVCGFLTLLWRGEWRASLSSEPVAGKLWRWSGSTAPHAVLPLWLGLNTDNCSVSASPSYLVKRCSGKGAKRKKNIKMHLYFSYLKEPSWVRVMGRVLYLPLNLCVSFLCFFILLPFRKTKLILWGAQIMQTECKLVS